MATTRKYHSAVPAFLHSRPRHFVVHCMNRLQSATHLKVSEVDEVLTVSGEVDSYKVSAVSETTPEMPNCTCIDWQLTYKPCKHLMKALSEGYVRWSSLPTQYRNFPLFSVDYKVTNNTVPSLVVSDTDAIADDNNTVPSLVVSDTDANDSSVESLHGRFHLFIS